MSEFDWSTYCECGPSGRCNPCNDRKAIEAKAKADAMASLIESVEAMVGWDWHSLLIDCADAETVISDAKLMEQRLHTVCKLGWKKP